MNLHHLHSLCYKKQPSLYSSPQIFLEHGYSGKSLSFSRLCSECLWFGFAIFKNVITLRTCGWVSVPQPWIFFPGETWAALSHDREKCQVSWEKTFWHLLHNLGKKKTNTGKTKIQPHSATPRSVIWRRKLTFICLAQQVNYGNNHTCPSFTLPYSLYKWNICLFCDYNVVKMQLDGADRMFAFCYIWINIDRHNPKNHNCNKNKQYNPVVNEQLKIGCIYTIQI